MATGEAPIEESRTRHRLRTLVAVAVGAVTLVASSGGSSPRAAERLRTLNCVTLQGWPIDPTLQLDPSTGAVMVAGNPSAQGKPQREWGRAAVLGASREQVDRAAQAGGTLAVAFTDPGGHAHVGTLPAGQHMRLDTDPDHQDLDEIGMLEGGGDAYFQLGYKDKDGTVRLFPTQLVGGMAIDLVQLAQGHPGTALVASGREVCRS